MVGVQKKFFCIDEKKNPKHLNCLPGRFSIQNDLGMGVLFFTHITQEENLEILHIKYSKG